MNFLLLKTKKFNWRNTGLIILGLIKQVCFYCFFKNGLTPAFFVYFRSFAKKQYHFYIKSMWKMSIQYMAPAFEPTTFQTWVVTPLFLLLQKAKSTIANTGPPFWSKIFNDGVTWKISKSHFSSLPRPIFGLSFTYITVYFT